MELKLSDQQKDGLRKKLAAIYLDEFEQEISDFKADRLLDAFLEQLAPAIHNAAVEDMKRYLIDQLEDLDALHRVDE